MNESSASRTIHWLNRFRMALVFLLLLLFCFLQVPMSAQQKTEFIIQEPYQETCFYGQYTWLNIALNGSVMSVVQTEVPASVLNNGISRGAYVRQKEWWFTNTGYLFRCYINKIYLKDSLEYDFYNDLTFSEEEQDSTELVSFYNISYGQMSQTLESGYDRHFEYDRDGRLTTISTYYKGVDVMSQKVITLNEAGKPVRVEENIYKDGRKQPKCPSDLSPRGKKKVGIVDTYWYDERGNKVAHQMNNGKNTKMCKYVYDSLNHMILEGSCNGYNGNNKTCKCKDFSAYEGYEYDDRHRLIRDYSIGEWQPEGMDNYYQYDSADRVIDYRHYTVRGTQRRFSDHIQTTYDSAGRMVKREALLGEFRINESIFDFTMAVLEECAYDKHGNLVEHVVYQTKIKPFKIVRYQYTYDQHGNWVKRIRYEGVSRDSNTVTEILERRIVYYE